MGKAIVIDETEVIVSRRGRTAEFDQDLLEDLAALEAGSALDLTPYFGEVESKDDRQAVGAKIRKHWRAVRDEKVRIDFGQNRPQVRVKR